jgi:hypothetical protein
MHILTPKANGLMGRLAIGGGRGAHGGAHRSGGLTSLRLLIGAAFLAATASPAAAANITFIKSIGTSTSTTAATTTAVTVPAAGVASGNSVILTVGLPSGLAGAVSAVDTQGNSYAVDADVTNTSNARIVVLSAHKITPLVSGNTITVTHPSTNRRNLIALEFAGLAASPVDQTATNTGTENNATPATTGTTAETTLDHELLLGAFGVSGPTSDNFTVGSGYTLGGRISASTTAPTVTNIAEYQIVNTAGEYSAGFTTTTTTARQYAAAIVTYMEDVACGNGTVDAGEECDEGGDNGLTTSCCTASCRYRASGQTCRPTAGTCDVAETCTGSSGLCPADAIRPTGFVCRPVAGECDLDEQCDGVTTACPADEVKPEDTPCTDDGTSCTIDICNGTSVLCQHPADTGSPCVKFIQTIGTSTSTTAATTTSVTVPAAGVAAGGSVILTVGLPSNALGTTGDVSATDTAGNVYTVDADVTNAANARIVVLSSHKVDPLLSGNTITVTHPSTNRRNLVAAEYSGLASPPNVDRTATNTGTENNANPATSGTTAVTTQDDELLIGAFGVSGPSSDNFSPGAGYASAGRVSASNTAPTVTNVQEYRVVNTAGAYSAGFTTTTTTLRQYAGAIVTYKADLNCGNGMLDAGEDCDLGFATNGQATVCCTRNCQFRSPTAVCRAQSGACDVAETCTGTSDTCPADAIRDTTFVCRAVAGDGCDPSPEFCDGVTKICPPDNLLPMGTPCTPDTNPCTVDQCTGTSATCNHATAGHAGAVCRPAAASCDAAEFCTGTSTTCPANGFLPTGTPCRPATDLCDVTETCTGLSQSCGPDNVRPNGFVCRAATDLCDVDDLCDGTSKACPDEVEDAGTLCRASVDICDVDDFCDGTNKPCVDEFEPATQVCRPEASDCDYEELCTGSGSACPSDVLRANGTLCVGTNPNFCKNACLDGACTDGELVTQQACCGNGLLDVDETCDDGNQISGDSCPSLPGDDCNFASSGTLVRANRKRPSTDLRGCQVEFAVTNAPSQLDKYGAPSWEQVCEDGDPACDFDPTPGRCRFAIAACLNNVDPNLPACVPAGVGSVQLFGPRRVRDAKDQLATENVAKLTAALGQLLDPNRPEDWYTNTLPVAAGDHNFCTGTVLVDVLAGSVAGNDYKKKGFTMKVRSVNLAGKRSPAQIRLMCKLPPAP